MNENKLLKHLKFMAKEYGWKVRFVEQLNPHGARPVYGEARSWLKTLYVAKKAGGKDVSIGNQLFVLAHEIRHMIHVEKKLYKSYYFDRSERAYEPCIVAVGMRAELDCDKWARNMIKAFGVKGTLSHRRYSKWKVSGYSGYQMYKTLAEAKRRG